MVLEVSTYHELQVSQIIASSVILTIIQSIKYIHYTIDLKNF
jgi:hypothetical protein